MKILVEIMRFSRCRQNYYILLLLHTDIKNSVVDGYNSVINFCGFMIILSLTTI